MKISYTLQNSPNKNEIKRFFEEVFVDITDDNKFSVDQNQILDDWFSVEEMLKYIENGQLIEARVETGELIGSIFIGKQNPISWPDGGKMEIFILGVAKEYRRLGVSKELINLAEKYAKEHQANSIIVNTHSAMDSVIALYQKQGYKKMGTLIGYYDNGDAVFLKKNL